MPLIQFPNIPALPGVPPLVRQAFAAATHFVTLLTGDDFALAGITATPRWGVFDDGGSPVAEADSFVEFSHSKEWRISDYPVEEGSFESYNKVETPYDERVTFSKGGTDADRAAFLQAIDDAVSSTDLFSVVTPEVTYVDANITHYDYRRQSKNGVTLLLVDLVLRQVRTTASSSFTNTAAPSGAAQVNGGTVQAQTPTITQSTAAAGGAG